MKYSCGVIKDLLPLYYEKMCSSESNEIIEEHLLECEECKKNYEELSNNGYIKLSNKGVNMEKEKAKTFSELKIKLLTKQIIIVVITLLILATSAFITIDVLKKSERMIEFNDNITVSKINNNIIGKMKGNKETTLTIKRVEQDIDGEEKVYLFFNLTGSKWNDITTSNKVYSEFMLCQKDKSADKINKVIYYTGEYDNLENKSPEEIQKVIDESKILWENDNNDDKE